MGFTTKYTFDQRKAESDRILLKYPEKIPIICEKYKNCKSLHVLDKNKFLAGNDMTMGQFVYVIRKRLKLAPSEAIFLFTNNILTPSSELLLNVYNEHKADDGFLYIHFSMENTFG